MKESRSLEPRPPPPDNKALWETKQELCGAAADCVGSPEIPAKAARSYIWSPLERSTTRPLCSSRLRASPRLQPAAPPRNYTAPLQQARPPASARRRHNPVYKTAEKKQISGEQKNRENGSKEEKMERLMRSGREESRQPIFDLTSHRPIRSVLQRTDSPPFSPRFFLFVGYF